MDSFLSFNQRFAKIRSKRLAKAVAGISKAPNPEVFIDLPAQPPAASKKRKAAPMALEQAAAAAIGGHRRVASSVLPAGNIAVLPHDVACWACRRSSNGPGVAAGGVCGRLRL